MIVLMVVVMEVVEVGILRFETTNDSNSHLNRDIYTFRTSPPTTRFRWGEKR